MNNDIIIDLFQFQITSPYGLFLGGVRLGGFYSKEAFIVWPSVAALC